MTLNVLKRRVADKPENVRPLTWGDHVPDGELKNPKGRVVRLGSEIRRKPTVLIFYRGGWSSSCAAHLGQLAQMEPEFFKFGFQTLAVSPDEPRQLRETLAARPLPFSLLSDASMEVIKKFGLAFKASPQDFREYQERGMDGEAAFRKHRLLLTVPAAYVADTDGRIHFAYYNPYYKIRVGCEELLKAVHETAQE